MLKGQKKFPIDRWILDTRPTNLMIFQPRKPPQNYETRTSPDTTQTINMTLLPNVYIYIIHHIVWYMVYTHHLVKIDCDHNFLMGPMKCSLTKSWQHLVTSCLKTLVSFSSKQKELHLCHDPLGPGIFLPSPWSKKKTHVAMIDLMVTCLIKPVFFFFHIFIPM